MSLIVTSNKSHRAAMATATLHSIQVGQPRTYGSEPPGDAPADPFGRPWSTGFYKQPVAGPVRLGATNLDGDGQADRENHGGPDKAVCVYSADHYPYWRETLGLDLPLGAFGENFTVEGLTEADVCIGDVWSVSGAASEAVQPDAVRVQVSQPRQPCWKLARRWRLKTLTAQVVENGRTGWYFRVLTEGTVAPGMALALVERPCPEWTVARANGAMYRDKHNRDAAKQLAYLPQLSASWREHFRQRAGELS
jgi:MOSC domain-containing protein YiiM